MPARPFNSGRKRVESWLTEGQRGGGKRERESGSEDKLYKRLLLQPVARDRPMDEQEEEQKVQRMTAVL